jgi:predicted transglutaminase-like cysteine proteinase
MSGAALFAVTLGACLLAGAAASAQSSSFPGARPQSAPSPANGEKIAFGQPAATPWGYYQLCAGDPRLCQARRGRLPVTRDGSVVASDATVSQLAAVNAEVNASIRPSHTNDWTPGRSVGDCKDYAMTKRQRLIAVGWPSSAALVAIVQTSAGEAHMVVVARTSAGDYVLDNRASGVEPWTSASYAWKKIQSPTAGLDWRSF